MAPELNGEYIDGTTIYREGDSQFQLYLPKYAGVDPNSGLALYYAKTTVAEDATDEEKAAFVPEVYVTSDYAVAQKTYREATGDLAPDMYGGFGTSLEFYGFDFAISFAYQLGGQLYDNTYAASMHSGVSSSVGRNWHNDIANAWTPENRFTDVPRLNYNDKYANSLSDRFLVSSNYLSLNNITFGYSLPKMWVRALGLNSVRIYGAADNVALFSARKGMDPRKSTMTTTTSTYGALRTISGGIKVTF